jgi:hypothetical protein
MEVMSMEAVIASGIESSPGMPLRLMEMKSLELKAKIA